MNTVISQENISFVKEVIDLINIEHPSYAGIDHTWVLIGSYAINEQKNKSDMDLLCFHERGEFERLKVKIRNVDVSICFTPITYLLRDGKYREYGGYFSAKCLNPTYFLNESHKYIKDIYSAGGEFIGEFAGYIASEQSIEDFTPNQIAAHAYLAFISLHPGYESYFLSYFISRKFDDIWKDLVNKVVKSFLTANIIKVDNNKYKYLKFYSDFREYNNQRLYASGNHWAFGSIAHNNDHRFLKWYFDNAADKMNQIDRDGSKLNEMHDFFRNIIGSYEIIY